MPSVPSTSGVNDEDGGGGGLAAQLRAAKLKKVAKVPFLHLIYCWSVPCSSCVLSFGCGKEEGVFCDISQKSQSLFLLRQVRQQLHRRHQNLLPRHHRLEVAVEVVI
jgi:hypothetical protein